MGGWRKATQAEILAVRNGRATQPLELMKSGRGLMPGNPIANEIQLAQRLQELCGAEGYRIEGGMILALRWSITGEEIIIDRFEAVAVQS